MWSQCRNLSIPLQCGHGSWGTSEVSPGESVPVSSGGMHVCFPPSCNSSVTLSFARIKGSGAFPRGFPTRLFHEDFLHGCPTCHRGVSPSSARKSRQCRENRFPWNGLRHLEDSGNGGKTLEFLSPQERPVHMRVARLPLGIPLPSMPGPKTLGGVCAGT